MEDTTMADAEENNQTPASHEETPRQNLSDLHGKMQTKVYRLQALIELCYKSNYFDKPSDFDYLSILSIFETEVKELDEILDELDKFKDK
jgi:hypothetical protein